jgi:predicted aldo/keto reductase-like oxidoreductase
VIRAAVESGIWDVVLTAYNFRQTHRVQVQAAIREAAAAGLGVVAMKTQAGVYWDRARRRRINMKAALKWVLQEECVHTTIPAFANFEEMEEDLSVMENLALTPEEKSDLALGGAMGDAGHFCQQCGECLPQCPAGMKVPTVMRAAMYALGHRQPAKARTALRGWTSADIACNDCAACSVRCALGLDVRSRGRDMARLLDVPEEFVG